MTHEEVFTKLGLLNNLDFKEEAYQLWLLAFDSFCERYFGSKALKDEAQLGKDLSLLYSRTSFLLRFLSGPHETKKSRWNLEKYQRSSETIKTFSYIPDMKPGDFIEITILPDSKYPIYGIVAENHLKTTGFLKFIALHNKLLNNYQPSENWRIKVLKTTNP